MIRFLVVTHGNLAETFVEVAGKVLDRPTDVIPICLDFDLNYSDSVKKITEAMKSLNSEDSAIILTDILGGTSSAISIPFIQKDKVEVITGLNLATLVYLLSQTEEKDFRQLCEEAKKAGKEAIVIAGEFLSGK